MGAQKDFKQKEVGIPRDTKRQFHPIPTWKPEVGKLLLLGVTLW